MISRKQLWILFVLLVLGGMIGIISSFYAPAYDNIKLIQFDYYGKPVWYRASQMVELVGQNVNQFLWLMVAWLIFYWLKFLPGFFITEYCGDWIIIDTIIVIWFNPNVDRSVLKIEMQLIATAIFLIRCWYLIYFRKRFKIEE